MGFYYTKSGRVMEELICKDIMAVRDFLVIIGLLGIWELEMWIVSFLRESTDNRCLKVTQEM